MNAILMDISLFGKKRIPRTADDFGDVATIGLHLKKRTPQTGIPDDYFGRYLGQLNNGKWGVGIKDLMTWEITSIVEYEDLDELKRNWQLD